MELREYERFKFEIADVIRTGKSIVEKRDTEAEQRCHELLVRLAEDRFNVVVAGRFSRGKTSLMNAVLGMDRLPTGIVPLTSVITTVRYGSRERVRIEYQRGGLPSEVPLAQLGDFVTQQGNPGNERGVKIAEVQLPAEILRRGFYFVDTPGLGSMIRANTLTTERFIPEIDALVLVTSFEGPLSADEYQFLSAARDYIEKIFVVVNKADLVTVTEQEQAIKFIEAQLSELFGNMKLPVISTSARTGLDAKKSGNAKQLALSGIESFEARLLEFLTTEKSAEMLVMACDRFLRMMDNSEERGEFAELRNRIAEIRKRIPGVSGRLARVDGASSASEFAVKADQGLRTSGCEVCSAILDDVFNYFSHYQYDLSSDFKVQRQHSERNGFCSLHSWQYAGLASPRGICTAYPTLLEHFADKLRKSVGEASVEIGHESLKWCQENRRCPACEIADQSEKKAIRALVTRLKTQQSVNKLSALCLHHLPLIVAGVELGTGKLIVERNAALLDRASEDMKRYALRHDAHRRDLVSEEELRAPRLAMSMLASHPNLAGFPWTKEE